MHIGEDANKAIERYGSDAPFVICELIASSILMGEAELAADFRRILTEVEEQLSVPGIGQ